MDFNKIQPEGYWRNTSESLNDNFNKVSAELDKISQKTSKDKGLFSSLDNLKNIYPEPEDGDWALVGTSLPAELYSALNGEWTKSGGTGGGDSQINLSDYIKSEQITDISQILD